MAHAENPSPQPTLLETIKSLNSYKRYEQRRDAFLAELDRLGQAGTVDPKREFRPLADPNRPTTLIRLFVDYSNDLEKFISSLPVQGYAGHSAEEVTRVVETMARNDINETLNQGNVFFQMGTERVRAADLSVGDYVVLRNRLVKKVRNSQDLKGDSLHEARAIYRAMVLSPSGLLSTGKKREYGTNPLFYEDLHRLKNSRPDLQVKEPGELKITDRNLMTELERTLKDYGFRYSLERIIQEINETRKDVLSFDNSPAQLLEPADIQFFRNIQSAFNDRIVRRRFSTNSQYLSLQEALEEIIATAEYNLGQRELPLEKQDAWFNGEILYLQRAASIKGVDYQTIIESVLRNPAGAAPDALQKLDRIIQLLDEQRGVETGYKGFQHEALVREKKLFYSRIDAHISHWIAEAKRARAMLRAQSQQEAAPPVPAPQGGAQRGQPANAPSRPLGTEGEPLPGTSKADVVEFYRRRLARGEITTEDIKRDGLRYLKALESSNEGSMHPINAETTTRIKAIVEVLGSEGNRFEREYRMYDVLAYPGASRSMTLNYDGLNKGGPAEYRGVAGNHVNESDYDYFLFRWERSNEVRNVVEWYIYYFSQPEIDGQPNRYYAPNFIESEQFRDELFEEIKQQSGASDEIMRLGMIMAVALDIRKYYVTPQYAQGYSPRDKLADHISSMNCHPSAREAYMAAGKAARMVNPGLSFVKYPREWIEERFFN